MRSPISTCVQLGIWPSADRLVVAERHIRRPRPVPKMTGYDQKLLEALQVRLTVQRIPLGYTDSEVGAFVGRSPLTVYRIRRRCKMWKRSRITGVFAMVQAEQMAMVA